MKDPLEDEKGKRISAEHELKKKQVELEIEKQKLMEIIEKEESKNSDL